MPDALRADGYALPAVAGGIHGARPDGGTHPAGWKRRAVVYTAHRVPHALMLCRADGHGYAHALPMAGKLPAHGLMVAMPCRTLCPLMATPCRMRPADGGMLPG